jgi:hypothetical protein
MGGAYLASFDVWACLGFQFNETDCSEVATNQEATSNNGSYDSVVLDEPVLADAIWVRDIVKQSHLSYVGISDVRIFASTCYDNCPEISNADQADTNDNGIGDVCE